MKVEELNTNTNDSYNEYITRISIGGKTYKLGCEIITVKPIVCKKCGGSFELKYGSGQCQYCGTYYTTKVEIEEVER
jgi:predicted Zn-ribbon and HTH transcriptional regulator